ncbi:craniofacial development protein 2, partial [Chelydra serpentina]
MESKATLKVIQAYAPTSASEGEEVEEFYRELERALAQKSTYTVTMGDFNAKVGRGKAGEKFIGRYGSGERNERGERLVAMAEMKELYVANTWYKKKISRRWTWIAPNAKSKNEIDYILVNKKRIVQDVSVVQPFNTGSDHRLLRAKLIFDEAVEKKALQMANRKQQPKTFDEAKLKKAISGFDWSQMEKCDEDYSIFADKLRCCIKAAEIKKLKKAKGRISIETKSLLEKRRNMKRSSDNNLEYSILCKLIRRKLKDDFENFRKEKLLKTANHARASG